MKIERKRLVLLSLLVFGSITAFAQKISQNVMQKIYDEVKTPYKYGMVVAPEDNYHKIDCPMVYREGNRWFMTYVVYNGKDGTNGRGYETWLATSDDLLQWKTLGRLLCYADKGWDMNQRAGYPALIDWTWNGSYEMAKYKGRHWMSYFGGEASQYGYGFYQRRYHPGSSLGNIPCACSLYQRQECTVVGETHPL